MKMIGEGIWWALIGLIMFLRLNIFRILKATIEMYVMCVHALYLIDMTSYMIVY